MGSMPPTILDLLGTYKRQARKTKLFPNHATGFQSIGEPTAVGDIPEHETNSEETSYQESSPAEEQSAIYLEGKTRKGKKNQRSNKVAPSRQGLLSPLVGLEGDSH